MKEKREKEKEWLRNEESTLDSFRLTSLLPAMRE
jgi:hypothetical protein